MKEDELFITTVLLPHFLVPKSYGRNQKNVKGRMGAPGGLASKTIRGRAPSKPTS
jgi:hypothetical protein